MTKPHTGQSGPSLLCSLSADVASIAGAASSDKLQDGPTDPDGDSLLHIRDPHARRDPRDKFTPAQIVAALETAGGIYLGATRLLRCSHTTIAGYVRRHADIRAAKAELDEELLDRAEAGLFQRMIDSSDPVLHLRACTYLLSTRGAARGYGRVAPAPVSIQATYVPSSRSTTVLDPSRLSNDELRTLVGLLAKASTPRADASPQAAWLVRQERMVPAASARVVAEFGDGESQAVSQSEEYYRPASPASRCTWCWKCTC